jgi:hypothetical protein
VGRHLTPLACDNCIPGDASGWWLPLALGSVAVVAVAYVAWGFAARAEGRRWGVALRVAAAALAAWPVVGLALGMSITYDGASCGSALSASLERGVPDDSALDHYQAGCKARGATVVRRVGTYGAVTLGAVVLAAVAGSVSPRSRARARVRGAVPAP